MKRFLYITLSAALIGGGILGSIPLTAQAETTQVGPGVGPNAPAGPSYTPYTPPKEIGPGIPDEEPEQPGSISDILAVPNNFLDKPIDNPIVQPVEKYTHQQMAADIQSLKNRYGDRLQVNTIGWSRDGKAIYEIIVGNIDAPKHVLLQGAIHGREYMTPLLMMNQVEMALANYDTGCYDNMALADMFQQTALHFVPMTNPDGVAVSQFGLDGIQSEALRQEILASYASDVAVGKTTAPLEHYLPYWKSNGAGVDLNNNFPAYWEELTLPTDAGSFANCKGISPLSEPETQALASLSTQRSWAAAISYHSMGNIIYWDTEGNQTAQASLALARSVSQVTGYSIDNSKGKGGYKDWMQLNGQMVPSITIEVGSVSCPMPLSEYPSVWNQNKSVWARVMNFVIHASN